MGGRGSSSGGGGGGSFSPSRRDENTSRLSGKNLSLGTNSVTIKGENGKTVGVVRGMSRMSTSNSSDQMAMHKFKRESGVDLRDFGVGNVYKADGKVYVFNNTKGDSIKLRLKNINKSEYNKLVEKNEKLKKAEKAGAYIINHG